LLLLQKAVFDGALLRAPRPGLVEFFQARDFALGVGVVAIRTRCCIHTPQRLLVKLSPVLACERARASPMPDLAPLRPALQGAGHHADLGVGIEAEGRLLDAEHALLQQQHIALA
jgi:hypothetical protein